MTNYEKIKNMTVDELAQLISFNDFENSEYHKWFENEKCGNCATVEVVYNGKKEHFHECDFHAICPIADTLVERAKVWLNAEVTK